jgi:hypothetical protein
MCCIIDSIFKGCFVYCFAGVDVRYPTRVGIIEAKIGKIFIPLLGEEKSC